ncbi:phage tail protein, partial [Burkholderia pseudomallei]
AYVSASGCKTKEEAAADRKQFGQREIMGIWPDWLGWDDTSNSTAVIPEPAIAAGLRATLDNDIGWHKSISNVVGNG